MQYSIIRHSTDPSNFGADENASVSLFSLLIFSNQNVKSS